MTDVDRDVEDVVEAIEQYVEFHPDASAIEVVAKRGLDPTRWKDVAEAIIAGEEPDIPDANPRGNADESGSNGPVSSDTDESDDGRELDRDDDRLDRGEWSDADFADSERGVYPSTLLDREQWMGRLADSKQPFSPWADRDHPEADADDDARFKWGLSENYVDGDTVAIAEDDQRLDGRVFIQRESDPFAFVDGDDVRDPETGEVHPAFVAILDRLGLTYADVSTSGSGVHAYYRGELPGGESGQEVFDIDDEPFGANDDAPTVEIYANKHVNVTTGAHVPGTPTDVRDWDVDALDDILDEFLPDDARSDVDVGHDTDRDRADLDDYDPDANAGETADDVRDVLYAVDRLDASDLPLRTSKVGEDSTGWEKWNPSTYRTSSGNDSLHKPPREAVFHDHKHGESFGVLSLYAAEEGIISKPWNRLAGDDFWTAVDAARDAGAPIPEYVPTTSDDVEREVVLPADDVVDADDGRDDWNWRHASRQAARAGGDDDLSIDAARERTTDAIADAYERGDRVLIEALPTLGKSYGAIAAAAETDEAITVLTGRGRKEQYAQIRDWCERHGLDYYTLPSFKRDCDTANGEHGEDWVATVDDWYARGATPQTIHAHAESELGRPLPCQEHEEQECPYSAKWRFDPDEYDVLIGHYSHANKRSVVQGRTVVLDEYPGGAYEQTLAYRLPSAVSRFLATTDAVPFEDYTDLVENRDDEQRRADALAYFLADGDDVDDGPTLDRDELDVLADDSAHALGPIATFVVLAGDDLGNGFERTDLGDHGVGLFDRRDGRVHILSPPALDYTSGVVGLDGTPTKALWELTLGERRLNHRQILSDDERREYVRDVLGLKLVRTTDAVKPYNSSDHVAVEQDAALLDAVRDRHGERPALITTAAAEHEYDADGLLDDVVDGSKHYGNVLGSNEFKTRRLGAVIGSNHYGDGFIKKIGAYAGETIERGDEKGAALSYGDFGDDVLTHMREHETLQAAMRFGRDGNGAVVYVHTDTLPDWVPIAGEGRVVKTWSDGQRDVLDAVRDLDDGWSTADVADHPAVSIGERQVRDHLHDLADRGYLDVDVDGNGYRWTDGELHRLNDHGEVELDAVDVDELDDEESAELSRTTTYTWSFRRSSSAPGRDGLDPTSTGPSTSTSTANRRDRGLDGGG